MKAHSLVSDIKSQGNGVYDLTTEYGRTLKIFICECYSFGAAEYVEATQFLGKIDAIVINSAWCGYTLEAKRLTRNAKVGLFKIGTLMSALNRADFWNYLTDQEREAFEKNGWL
jgi:hypothetical protein